MPRNSTLPEYYEGDVFQNEHRIRRIIGFANDRKGIRCVVYSSGGDRNRKCRLRQFHKFALAGKLVHEGRGRPQ